jgi:protein AATF/BFR2
LSLGKEYEGASIAREQLFRHGDDNVEESDDSDDPFAKAGAVEDDESDTMEGDEEDFVDPDKIDLDAQLEEDGEIDSDDAFGEGEEEAFKHFKFRASKSRKQTPSEDETEGLDDGTVGGVSIDEKDSAQVSEDDAEEDEIEAEIEGYSDEDSSEESFTEDDEFNAFDDEEEDGTASEVSMPKDNTRAGLAALMADQHSTVATMSQAIREDVTKGNAVKTQRSTFDSLLNTRIRLQKALVASNSIIYADTPAPTFPSDQAVIEAAESAALQLFNSLSALRACLPSTSSSKKRQFSATLSTSSEEIRDHLSSLDKVSSLRTRPNLAKWATKTQEVAAVPKQNKFSQASIQPLTSVLDTQLSGPNLSRLVSRTRTPRNCAPLQSESGVEEDPKIYDDADWYSLLLRDLVDSRIASSSGADRAALATTTLNGPTAQAVSALRKESKQHRKGVDVKASKGRKMRYTVHEKLQNFMAPEDKGLWEGRQADELFAGLLGRKVKGGLGEAVEEESDEDEAVVKGLRLFGGA